MKILISILLFVTLCQSISMFGIEFSVLYFGNLWLTIVAFTGAGWSWNTKTKLRNKLSLVNAQFVLMCHLTEKIRWDVPFLTYDMALKLTG